MLSVAGGKLTTYRKIALDALARLRGDLGIHRLDRRPWPLPDVPQEGGVPLPVDVAPHVRSHLLHLYGERAREVLEPAVDDPTLLEPLHPGGPDIAAQAVYAARSEWAVTAEDVVRRRTTLVWRGLDGPETRERVAALSRLGSETREPRPRASGSAR
jgi:glycerol-3-phosphate dehydrogenase